MTRFVVEFLKKHVKALMVIADVFAIVVAFVVSSYLKFDAPVLFKVWFEDNMYYIFAVDVITTLLSFSIFKVYKTMWQYVVISDYLRMVKAYFIAKVITVASFFYIWLYFICIT